MPIIIWHIIKQRIIMFSILHISMVDDDDDDDGHDEDRGDYGDDGHDRGRDNVHGDDYDDADDDDHDGDQLPQPTHSHRCHPLPFPPSSSTLPNPTLVCFLSSPLPSSPPPSSFTLATSVAFIRVSVAVVFEHKQQLGVGQPVAPSSAPTQDEQTKRPGDPQNTFSIRIMNLDITYADYAPASRSTFASLILRHTGILVAQAMTYHKWHARGRSETYVVFCGGCNPR